jgi:type II secretory pathway predicted ATPase ExeA
MYETHWGLARRPFEDAVSEDTFYRSETHRAAALKLRYVIDSRQGAAILCGESGTGKSFLSRLVTQKLAAHGTPTLHLNYPRMQPGELLGWLACELARADSGHPPARTTLDALVRDVEARLVKLTGEGRRPVLVIDDAHLVNEAETLEAWHTLLNFRQCPGADLTLVLVGGPALLTRLRQYRPLAERVGVTALLRPLGRAETEQYVQHRLAVAGRIEPVFTADALDCLFAHTNGVPRRINRIGDLALLVGFAERLDRITASEIEGVAEELTLGLAA